MIRIIYCFERTVKTMESDFVAIKLERCSWTLAAMIALV
jgi:hypothetical protein